LRRRRAAPPRDSTDRAADPSARGAARRFTGTLDQWTYEPLREADRVADLIVAKLLERHPAPAFKSGVVAPDWLS
jgi:hypothetical protein